MTKAYFDGENHARLFRLLPLTRRFVKVWEGPVGWNMSPNERVGPFGFYRIQGREGLRTLRYFFPSYIPAVVWLARLRELFLSVLLSKLEDEVSYVGEGTWDGRAYLRVGRWRLALTRFTMVDRGWLR